MVSIFLAEKHILLWVTIFILITGIHVPYILTKIVLKFEIVHSTTC